MRGFRQPPSSYYPGSSAPLYQSRKRRVAGFVTRHALAGARVGVRAGFKHRAKIWPFLTGLGMLALSFSAGQIQDGWKTCIILAILAGVVLGWKQWQALRAAEEWARASIIVSWATWAACAAWTATAAATGPLAVPMAGLLAAGTVFAQGWWFWHQYIREAHHEVETDIEERGEQILNERGEQWRVNIACDGGALPGSYLVGVNDLYNDDGILLGWEAIIQLPLTGALTSEHALAVVKRIAKIYGVPATQVQVELPLDGLEDTARLAILNRNWLSKTQTFEGPTLDPRTGRFVLGRHGDGTNCFWQLYKPGSGACHGMVAGTTDAGKSGILRNLCAEIRHSGNNILLLADPEDGGSVGDWQLGAHVFAGTIPKIRRMLQGVERIMESRKKRWRGYWTDTEGRKHRGRTWTGPTDQDPGIYVVIDEAPDVLADPECRRIIALLGKKGRKWGISVTIFVQIPSLAELGGDLAVRSMLSSMNIVILRTSDSLSAQMGTPMKLPVDPAALPAFFPDGSVTSGLGYRVTADARVSPMRAAYQEDCHEWATTGDAAPWNTDDLAAGCDENGNYFIDWEALLDCDDEEEEAELRERLAATGAHVVQIPYGTKEKIIAFLRDRGEPVRLGVIADAVGVSKPATHNQLKRLRNDRVVFQPTGLGSHGKWGLTPARELQDEMATSGVA